MTRSHRPPASANSAPQSALTRRGFLKGSALAGCSAAAWPLLTPVTLAAAPGENRLVVIILRGAMDGLDALRPVGDPGFAKLRDPGTFTRGEAVPLDGMFALHPALAPLSGMWQAGELGFAHAVATPYRDKRSHFDGQDILEAGTGRDVPEPQVRDGWLNRLVQITPGATAETAFAIGREPMQLLAGDAPVMQWTPGTELAADDQSERLLEWLYEDDPLFHAAGSEAFMLSGEMAGDAMGGANPGARAVVQMAEFAAERLRAETRIAAFSIGGWDTHRNQRGVLTRRLGALAETLLALKAGLGPEWGRTTVLAMTEFGRTVRINGTGGTDHGTGGAMLMAGGALRGGRAYGTWPGLGPGDLYKDRDLMPTEDVRRYAAWALAGLFGTDQSALETAIFPGLDMGTDPGILL